MVQPPPSQKTFQKENLKVRVIVPCCEESMEHTHTHTKKHIRTFEAVCKHQAKTSGCPNEYRWESTISIFDFEQLRLYLGWILPKGTSWHPGLSNSFLPYTSQSTYSLYILYIQRIYSDISHFPIYQTTSYIFYISSIYIYISQHISTCVQSNKCCLVPVSHSGARLWPLRQRCHCSLDGMVLTWTTAPLGAELPKLGT